MSFVLLITGPTGSGKTTVARRVAKLVDKCVNIDIDHVKHFIVTGFIYDETSEGDRQWQLLGDNLGALASNFVSAGYNVIINGYMHDSALIMLKGYVQITDKVLLLPNMDVVVKRDDGRDEDIKMGAEMVKEHHNHLSSSDLYSDFIKLDTTHHTVEETVSKVLEIVKEDKLNP